MEIYEHNPGDHDDPLHGPLWIIGLLGGVLLTVVILGLTALLYNAQREQQVEKIISHDPQELLKFREAHRARITAEPRWVEAVEPDENGKNRIVTNLVIPIDQAMEVVVKEETTKRPNVKTSK